MLPTSDHFFFNRHRLLTLLTYFQYPYTHGTIVFCDSIPRKIGQMNTAELVVSFEDDCHFAVAYNGNSVKNIPFENPMRDKDRRRLAWYLESYATQPLAELYDDEAARIERRIETVAQCTLRRQTNQPAFRSLPQRRNRCSLAHHRKYQRRRTLLAVGAFADTRSS